jgi:hypothetical protein
MRLQSLRRPRGQDMAEFAITFSIFMAIVVVFVDLGRVAFYYSAIHNGAREGARYGIIYPADIAGIQDRVENLAIGMDPADLTISTSYPNDDTIQVSVIYNFEPITPFMDKFLEKAFDVPPGTPFFLETQAVMQLEQ